MVKMYAALIINGRRTFERVPDDFKMAVEAYLTELGYDTNGNKLKPIA